MNNPNTTHTLLMHALASEHEVLLDLIGSKSFHYVDIPVHGNIGDLLIMQGTLAFFRRHGLRPRIIAPAFAYKPEWIREGDVVVFHGGGNFGDLYTEYGMQSLRESVVSGHLHNRIIVLPQTVHFSSTVERARSARVFREHPDLHICVRDSASYEIASEFTDHVYLLPDMAHQLYRIESDSTLLPQGSLLISRTDGESGANHDGAAMNVAETTDWPHVVGDSERNIDNFRRGMRAMHKAGLSNVGNRLMAESWALYSAKLINNAIRLFARHEHIITDRLHGHILACLMDKPNTVIDNSYGKNSTYVNAWTAHSKLVSQQAGLQQQI